MESLTNNQAFIDGNKRVAFASVHTFLLANGITIQAEPAAIEKWMLESVANGTFRFNQILDWIRQHTKPMR